MEWDKWNQKIKINPLAFWTLEQVWDYARKNDVPYNKLHDKGYPSIGCQSCTRAIKPGEGTRTGRWWWTEFVLSLKKHSQLKASKKID